MGKDPRINDNLIFSNRKKSKIHDSIIFSDKKLNQNSMTEQVFRQGKNKITSEYNLERKNDRNSLRIKHYDVHELNGILSDNSLVKNRGWTRFDKIYTKKQDILRSLEDGYKKINSRMQNAVNG